MHITIKTTDVNAMGILRGFCNNNKISFESLVIEDKCILTIKNPNPEILRTISRFSKSLSRMTDITSCVYVDKFKEPIDLEEFDI